MRLVLGHPLDMPRGNGGVAPHTWAGHWPGFASARLGRSLLLGSDKSNWGCAEAAQGLGVYMPVSPHSHLCRRTDWSLLGLCKWYSCPSFCRGVCTTF